VKRIRAAFHVHSEWSYDAKIPLTELSALFARHGYDAVFMCEHDRGFDAERLEAYAEACERASAAGALLIPGIEYADAEDRVHVPVWGDVPFLGEAVPTGQLLEDVAAHDGVSVLAHPVRRDAWETVQPEWLRLCTGIEIWTRKWDGWAPNPQACRWAAQANLVGVASLDLHQARQTFPLAMQMEIADPLSAESCVEAFRQRRCHAIIHGLPAAPLTHGGLGRCARAVERLRRPLWRAGRRGRERLASRG
jgi:predicted metal-dependent phosphoesterase TrpH